MYIINNNTVIDFSLSKSLRAYFHDEFRNSTFNPDALSSLSDPDDIIITHSGESHLFNTIER